MITLLPSYKILGSLIVMLTISVALCLRKYKACTYIKKKKLPSSALPIMEIDTKSQLFCKNNFFSSKKDFQIDTLKFKCQKVF